MPAGETPLEIVADVHFATLVSAFMEALEYGMKRAQAVCKGRVNHLQGDVHVEQKSVEVNPRRHFNNFSPHSAKVRELLLKATNGGLADAMTPLSTKGGVLFQKHTYAASPTGTGVPMLPPTFMRLRELVEESATASLAENASIFLGSPLTRQQAQSGQNRREPKTREGNTWPLRKVGLMAAKCSHQS